MKILILASAFPPEAEGAATHLPEMATALQKLGYRVHVLAVVNRHEVRDTYPFRVRRISRSQFRPVRDLRILISLFKESRRCKAFYVYGLWWQATLVSLITGIPLVVKFTGDKTWEAAVEEGKTKEDIEDFPPSPKPLGMTFTYTIMKWMARLSDRLVVSCDTLARVLLQWGLDRSRIEVIPNALPENPKDTEEATYLAQWQDFEGLRLVTGCHITSVKMLDGLLEVISRFDDVRLVVAGDGPDSDRIKSLTRRMNLGEKVIFTGKVSRQDLAGYIQESDILVLNSQLGRFNYTILEALAQGKPVFATRRGLHGDFIEHGINGWLYNDIDELSELIESYHAKRIRPVSSTNDPTISWQRQVELTFDLLDSTS